jgi:addiction module HigA family antidote
MERVKTSLPEVLQEEYMKPLNINAKQLAKALKVSEQHMGLMLSGWLVIDGRQALLLGKLFGTTPLFWLNLQSSNQISAALADERFAKTLADTKSLIQPVEEKEND